MLRDKFILYFILLACIPILVLGGTTLYLIDLAHQQDIANLQNEVIDRHIEEAEKFFVDTLGILDLHLEALDQQNLEAFQNEWQEPIAKSILVNNSNIEEIRFINLEGKETIRILRGGADQNLLYVSETSAFQIARKGDTYIGRVYQTMDGPMITIATPVFLDTTVIQILVAEVHLSSLIQSFEITRLGNEGYVVLFDTNGVYISERPRGSIPIGYTVSDWSRFHAFQDEHIQEKNAVQNRYESIFGTGPVIGAGKQIAELGWVVLAEWPIADADVVINDVRNQIIIVTIASIIVILLAVPLISLRLVQPIRQLEKQARDIEQGNFDRRVSIKTGDELEQLGNAFNGMAKGLKRLQELKNEFVFVAAHELRAPTTVIKGYISMLLDGSTGTFSDEAKDYLVQTNNANEQLLQLVSDLLEIARSDANKIQIEVAPMDLQKSIHAIISEVKPLTVEKHITISYEHKKSSVMVLADAARVKEIIMNFVTNGIKYNRENGTLTIRHEIKKQEIITHVKDAGFGIPKDEQKKIFEKFYRTKSARTSGVQGTGLGLFITKELVERMGGKIWFKSEEGKGTTFSFSLPKGSGTMPS